LPIVETLVSLLVCMTYSKPFPQTFWGSIDIALWSDGCSSVSATQCNAGPGPLFNHISSLFVRRRLVALDEAVTLDFSRGHCHGKARPHSPSSRSFRATVCVWCERMGKLRFHARRQYHCYRSGDTDQQSLLQASVSDVLGHRLCFEDTKEARE